MFKVQSRFFPSQTTLRRGRLQPQQVPLKHQWLIFQKSYFDFSYCSFFVFNQLYKYFKKHTQLLHFWLFICSIRLNNQKIMLNLQNSHGDRLHNIEHKVEGKCVCEACTCGKHHCPSPKKKGEFHSSYADEYKNFDVPSSRVRRVQEPLPETHYDPNDIQSSYQNSFKPADPQQVSKSRQNNRLNMIKKNYIMPTDGFYGASSYGTDYTGEKALRPDKFVIPNNLKTSNQKFNGESTYHSNYVPGQTERIKPVDRPPSNTGLGKGKFQDNFQGKNQGRQQKYIQKNQIQLSKSPFQGSSSYGADYASKGTALRAERAPQIKNQVMPQGRFQGDSNYHSSFVPSKIQRNPQFRPQGQLKIGGSFEGSSSYGADYANKGNALRAQRAPVIKNQVMPEGKFDGDSTYHNSYIPGKIQKNRQFRPEGQLKIGGVFQGASSYGADYANKGNAPRAQRAPLVKNQVMPEGRFQGDSTYHNSFIPGQAQRNQKIVPQGQLKIGGQWQGTSSYGADYANKGTIPRAQRAPQIKNQVMPQGRFEGDSDYHSNFVPSKIQKNQQFRRQGELKIGGTFEGASSYGAEFANKGTPARAQRVLHAQNQVFPKGKFEGDSNYNSNFIGAKAQRNAQFRPHGQLKIGGTFEGSSSYGNDYKMGNIPKKEVCPTQILKAPKYEFSDKDHVRYNSNKHSWE